MWDLHQAPHILGKLPDLNAATHDPHTWLGAARWVYEGPAAHVSLWGGHTGG